MSKHSGWWTRLPVFDGLTATHLDLLSQASREEWFDARELLFHEGDEADAFYVVHEGGVTIEVFVPDRGAVTIQTVGSGEILGWSWLVEPYRWHFDAHAVVGTQVVAFDAPAVRAGFESHPEFGYLMLKRLIPIIVQRLQATRLQLLDLYHVRT